MIAILSVVGLIAVLAPPNNWDSMTYHLARVAHWIQNGSVAHYPTAILRQLHQAPFAEYVVANLQLLAGGDQFANLVQWGALAASVVAAAEIAGLLGAAASGRAVAALVAATLPIAILQGSSTQNDLVNGALVLIGVLNLLELLADANVSYARWLELGAALGLAVLTKSTAYLFLFPFVLMLGWRLLARSRRVLVPAVLLTAVPFVVLHLGYVGRNVSTYGSPLGPGEEAGGSRYLVDRVTPGLAVSGVVRNLALHVETRSNAVNDWFTRQFKELHAALGVDPDDPRTTWAGQGFYVPLLYFHEDWSGNLVHASLIGLTFVWVAVGLARRRTRSSLRTTALYGAACAVGFLAFAILIRWQPWHTRLHLPVFLLLAAFVGAASRHWPRPVVFCLAAVLLIGSVPWLVWNRSRPLLAGQQGSFSVSVLSSDRQRLLFSNRDNLIASYERVTECIAASGCQKVGLRLGNDDWEYPLFRLIGEPARGKVRFEHVDVANPSGRYAADRPIQPCLLVGSWPQPPSPAWRRSDACSGPVLSLFVPATAQGP